MFFRLELILNPEPGRVLVGEQTKGFLVITYRIGEPRNITAIVLARRDEQVADLRPPVVSDLEINLALYPRGPGMEILHIEH